jgi:hypothetical protein
MKVDKLSAMYLPHARSHMQRCEVCKYFVAHDACTRVEGMIDRDATCLRFFELRRDPVAPQRKAGT